MFLGLIRAVFPQTEFQENIGEKRENWLAWQYSPFLKFSLELLEWVRKGQVLLSSLWKRIMKRGGVDKGKGLGKEKADAVMNATHEPRDVHFQSQRCAEGHRNPPKHRPLFCGFDTSHEARVLNPFLV